MDRGFSRDHMEFRAFVGWKGRVHRMDHLKFGALGDGE